MTPEIYQVTAKLNLPKFARVRRYLQTENEFIERKLQHRPKWWENFSIPGLGIFQHRDWKQYSHELAKYEHKVEQHAEDIHSGVLPLKFTVWHHAAATDRHIKIALKVEHGKFHQQMKSPEPPARIDGGKDRQGIHHLPKISRFSRSGIKLTDHKIEVEFSQLDAEDNAVLLNRTLYLETTSETRVLFEIVSDQVRKATGEVLMTGV